MKDFSHESSATKTKRLVGVFAVIGLLLLGVFMNTQKASHAVTQGQFVTSDGRPSPFASPFIRVSLRRNFHDAQEHCHLKYGTSLVSIHSRQSEREVVLGDDGDGYYGDYDYDGDGYYGDDEYDGDHYGGVYDHDSNHGGGYGSSYGGPSHEGRRYCASSSYSGPSREGGGYGGSSGYGGPSREGGVREGENDFDDPGFSYFNDYHDDLRENVDGFRDLVEGDDVNNAHTLCGPKCNMNQECKHSGGQIWDRFCKTNPAKCCASYCHWCSGKAMAWVGGVYSGTRRFYWTDGSAVDIRPSTVHLSTDIGTCLSTNGFSWIAMPCSTKLDGFSCWAPTEVPTCYVAPTLPNRKFDGILVPDCAELVSTHMTFAGAKAFCSRDAECVGFEAESAIVDVKHANEKMTRFMKNENCDKTRAKSIDSVFYLLSDTASCQSSSPFVYVDSAKDFVAAQMHCRSQFGTSLVSLHSPDAEREAVSLINWDDMRDVWLGATRASQTVKFYWIDGSIWNFGSMGKDEQLGRGCAVLRHDDNRTDWTVDDCSHPKRFLCWARTQAPTCFASVILRQDLQNGIQYIPKCSPLRIGTGTMRFTDAQGLCMGHPECVGFRTVPEASQKKNQNRRFVAEFFEDEQCDQIDIAGETSFYARSRRMAPCW